jgi:hypothetical protein
MIASSLTKTWLTLLCVALLSHTLAASALCQETPTSAVASDEVKKALDDQAFPWYDPKTESEKPVSIIADPDETGQRDSKWLGSGDWQTKRNTRAFRPSFGWLSTVFQVIFWFLVAGLLLGLSYVVITAFMKMDAQQANAGGGADEEDEEQDKTRIENLPFQVKRPNANLLEEAKACYERGEYNDAIVYLYSHQLIELDRRQAIYLTKGKTNRQYLRELRERPALENILESSVLLFEEAFFGRHTITKSQFDRCWAKLPDFDRELERVTT